MKYFLKNEIILKKWNNFLKMKYFLKNEIIFKKWNK